MWIVPGIVAGLFAGIFMGIFSQLGYYFGTIRSHLIVIDGTFALHLLKRSGGTGLVYAAGIFIHLATSLVFGIVYVAVAKLAGFDSYSIWPIVVYVFLLWLAMLAVALPVAGQGFMGRRIRGSVWLEQLVLHAIYGTGFWWALRVF